MPTVYQNHLEMPTAHTWETQTRPSRWRSELLALQETELVVQLVEDTSKS